jgi:hypothetical protein
MTEEIKQTHYDVEDEPKADVDTTLAMYQQSKAVVAAGTARAEGLLGEAGPILETIYNIASASQDSEMMAAVDAAWAKTQELAQIVGQHNAALNGANVVIDVMKQSRDAALDELNTILKGLEEGDSSLHPLLQEFEQQIEDYSNEWAYEDAMEYADEIVDNQFFDTLDSLVKHESSAVRWRTVQNLVAVMRGLGDMSDEQKGLIEQLLKTCMPETLREALGLAPVIGDDDEDIEDGDDE